MNKMDELFKNKLENYPLLPSPDAWEKVERQLEKKSKLMIWWRAAAAVLLVGVVGWWTYTWQTSNPTSQTAAKTESFPAQSPAAIAKTPINSHQSTNAPTPQLHKPLAKHSLPKSSTPRPSAKQQTTLATKEVEASSTEVPVVAQLVLPPAANPAVAAQAQKPIVLEFTLQPIATETVATARAEKRSIKSVLMDLKNGEGNINFQTLRENLFAFNHKKQKPTETQE
jgi:hypothetical protein